MTRLRFHSFALAALLAGSMGLAACGSGGEPTGGEATGGDLKIAAIFSGPTNDADYNAIGLAALNAAKENGAEVSFSEKVAVPDIEARLNEAVGDGNTVIWTHGSQFADATVKVAKDNPDVNFIAEYDGEYKDLPANVWTIDRQFHLGFYGMGVFAANLSKTGTVGYVGGLSLPFSFAEVHAMEQAFEESGSSVTLKPVWTGDFNDAAKAQQFTTQLLDSGADVIVGSLNQGATGTFQAFEGKPAGAGWVTAKYTDKSAAAGEHYAGSLDYDFTKPLADVLDKIQAGTTTGRYPLGFETGVTINVSDNVPADVKTAVDEAVAKVEDGTITVKLDDQQVG